MSRSKNAVLVKVGVDGAAEPGVVGQHVEPPELAEHLGDRGGPRVLVGDVEVQRQSHVDPLSSGTRVR